MRKILLVTMLLTIMGGVSSVKAERVYASPANGTETWTAGTSTFSWKNTSNNYIELGLPTGDISMYSKFHVTVSDFSDNANFIRLVVKNGKDPQITEYINAGEFNVDLVSKYSTFDFTRVSSIQMFGSNGPTEGHVINNDNPASVVITNIYLERPNEFIWDETGKASINKTGLTASGGLTYEPSTGVLTSDGTAGTLILELATPTDLRNVFQFNVSRSGASGSDDIVNRLKFYDEDNAEINTWNSIKWSNTWNSKGIDDNATNAFLNHKPVKKLVWESDAEAAKAEKTLTITSVEFTQKTISCAIAGEKQLNTLPYKTMAGESTTPAWNMGIATSLYYGSNTGDAAVSYADVTDYEEIRIYRNDNTGFRAFFINSAGTNVNTINNGNAASTWNAEGKYWSIDLSKVETYGEIVALQGIKAEYGWYSDVVKNIVAYKTPDINAPKYILTGSGFQLAETAAALADETATSIDATGVSALTTDPVKYPASKLNLTTANPNCLVLASANQLTNENNVIVSGECNSLVLEDNHPFKAPADFTATAASYSTTINTTAQCGTLCLPFAATIPGGVTAYTLSYVSGNDAATLTPVGATIPANTPVLLNGSGAATFTGSGAINADATNVSGALTGVFANTAVPFDSYVLQNGASGIGFYKVASDITAKPFRAYLTGQVAGSKEFLSFNFDDATGVNSLPSMESSKFNVQSSKIYNLAGQRMSKLQKGVNIVNGKKVLVK